MKFSLSTFALLLGLATGLGLAQTATATTQVERAALVRIFNQNGGPNWTNSTNWNGPQVCGFWFGVTCDDNGNLVGLDLHNNNLTGKLPALTDLAGLSTFNFSQNFLTGPIPGLTDLTNLQDFNISSNQFSGSIPSLAGLNNLQTFDAFSNQLTGPLPALTGLVNLQTLNLGNNQLTGSMANVQQASGLAIVNLGGNALTGTVPDLSGLTSLRRFNIGGNGLTGSLPLAPSSLTNGLSTLCRNPLVPAANPPSAIDTAWNAATGQNPWSKDCTTRPTLVSVSVDNASADGGVPVKVSIIVSANDGVGAPLGNVTVADDLDFSAICTAALSPVTANQSSGECTVNFTSIGKHTLTAGYLGDFTFAPNSNIAVVINPVLADAEFAALLQLFADTDGDHWARNDNWNNHGDPCAATTPWFGVTCSLDRAHVVALDLHNNRLSGTSLVISGGATAIEHLISLRSLNISSNQLRGDFPNLFELKSLQSVLADHNGFTFLAIPPGSASLINGASKLCPNALTPASEPPSADDKIWNAATGTTPWSKDCIQHEVKISVSTNANPAHIGDVVTVSVTVAPLSGGGTPTGGVRVTDNLPPNATCHMTLTAGSASNCTLKFVSNGAHQIIADYEGDDLFALNETSKEQIIEALPDSERAVLDALFLRTDGPHWSFQLGWPNGESCKRAGVTCDADGAHVLRIEMLNNNLVGSLPPLSALTGLQFFDAGDNQLRGSIPPLSDLKNLVTFRIFSNQLTGSIPDLAGLTNLQTFDLPNNRLTGSIPLLSDLVNLQELNVSGNGLTGLPPAPPSNGLTAALCPNPLTPSAEPPSENDKAWNAITHSTPWSKSCSLSAARVTLSATPNPVQSNNAVAITITVAPAAGGTGAPDGTVTVADSLDLDVSCTTTLKGGRGACGLLLFHPGTHTLTAGYSGSDSLSPGSGSTEVKVLTLGSSHLIGGIVSGNSGSGLTLSLNAGVQTLAIPANTNGGFSFPTPLADGSTYTVTVLTQPTTPAQTCTVANGTGTLAGEDVFTIAVNCSAATFTVTPQAGPFGTIAPSTAQIVAAGATATFTVVPDAGNALAAASGCGGGLSSANVYTTAPIDADCTVTVTFSDAPVSGVCGADNGQTLSAPPVRLCSAGTPSAAIGSGPWTWTCAGSNGGASANCSANGSTRIRTTATLNLNPNPAAVDAEVTASVSVTAIPSLASRLDTAAAVTLSGTVQVSDGTVSCIAPPSGSCPLHFATPGVHTVTATYSGDATFAGSSVTTDETVDAAVENNFVQAPTLSEWLLGLLVATLSGIGMLGLRRRTAPRHQQ